MPAGKATNFKKKRLFSNIYLQDLTQHEAEFHPKGLATVGPNGEITEHTVTDAFLYNWIEKTETSLTSHRNSNEGNITSGEYAGFVKEAAAASGVLHLPLQKKIKAVSDKIDDHTDVEKNPNPHPQYSRSFGVPIGTVVFCMTTIAGDMQNQGYIPADGSIVEYEDFPSLYEFAMKNYATMCCKESDWVKAIDENKKTGINIPKHYPNQAKFTFGWTKNANGTYTELGTVPPLDGDKKDGVQYYKNVTHFRVPCLGGFFPRIWSAYNNKKNPSANAGDNAFASTAPVPSAGTVSPHGIPRIFGQFTATPKNNSGMSGEDNSGPFKMIKGYAGFETDSGRNNRAYHTFDSALTTPTADDIRPWSVSLPAYIKAWDIAINEGKGVPPDVYYTLESQLQSHLTDPNAHPEQTHIFTSIYEDNSKTVNLQEIIQLLRAADIGLDTRLEIVEGKSGMNSAIDYTRSIVLPFQSESYKVASRTIAKQNAQDTVSPKLVRGNDYGDKSVNMTGVELGKRRYVLRVLQPFWIAPYYLHTNRDLVGSFDADCMFVWSNDPRYATIGYPNTSDGSWERTCRAMENSSDWWNKVRDWYHQWYTDREYPAMPIAGKNLFMRMQHVDGSTNGGGYYFSPGAPFMPHELMPTGWWVLPTFGTVRSDNETDLSSQFCRYRIFPTIDCVGGSVIAELYYYTATRYSNAAELYFDVQPLSNMYQGDNSYPVNPWADGVRPAPDLLIKCPANGEELVYDRRLN